MEEYHGTNTHKVAVVGGGITGLAAAHKLQEQGQQRGIPLEVTVYEKLATLGGKIATEKHGDLTIEGGPDCFLRQKPWAAQLARQIGLADQLMGTNDDRRKTFVLNNGRLTPLPDGVMLIIPTRIWPFVTSGLISWPGKMRMGMDLLIPPYQGESDESIADFVRRRLGHEALDKIAEPLLSGIHVSDPEEQSLLATFPRFRTLEQKNGSLIKGMLAQRRNGGGSHAAQESGPTSIFITLREGVGQLVDALQASLGPGVLQTGKAVIEIQRRELAGYTLALQDGSRVSVDAILLATPANVSTQLVAGLLPELSNLLAAIRFVSTATISLAYRKTDLTRPLDGFGFVVPQREKRRVSACTWVTTKFRYRAPDDTAILRCFVGGPGQEDTVDYEDADLLDLVGSELERFMGLRARPFFHRIFRWHKSHPQYDVGHLNHMQKINDQVLRLPGLYLAGSSYDGVGIPDCIRQGQAAAEKMAEFLQLQMALRPA